jgi:dTDP-4-dehydrorhamnose reductase
MRKPNSILVIGATGQVGRAFRSHFGKTGSVVFTERAPKDPLTRALDLADERAIVELITTLRPTIVINCAAYTAVDMAEKEPDAAMAINGEAVAAIAKASSGVGAQLIHYSTDYVFDGQGDRPWRPDDKTNPVNKYGASKLAGERAVLEHCPRGGYVFRTQWVYDREGKNFLTTMLRLGAEREELSVVGDQIGAPTSAEAIARYTLRALPRIVAGKMPPGIYHLACRGEVSWHGFAEAIFAAAKNAGLNLKVKKVKKILTSDYPTPAVRPKNSRLNVESFEAAIGEELPQWADELSRVMNLE